MRVVKLGGIAVAGALAATSAFHAPAAAAVTGLRPSPSPREPTRGSPRPTVTRTVTPKPRTVTPKPQINCNPQRGSSGLSGVPWAQQRFNFDQVWKLTRGDGVSVGVVDSGVDSSHPQLSDRVTSADLTRTITRDCIGHGTAIAGIIGAQDLRSENIPFVGVAPGARLVSVKFTNEDHSAGADPRLPKAIERAVDMKARVVNVSVTAPDTPALRSAVEYAQRHDVVVVAAAGNVQDSERGSAGPAYPAEYPNVISVASMARDGSLADSSNTASRVSVSAPGKEVATTWPDGYAPSLEGTSFAAAFVSGVAALVRAYHPDLDYRQVKRRIEETADGSNGAGTGKGMVNPMQAVTALLRGENGQPPVPPAAAPARPIQVEYRRSEDRHTRSIAFIVTGAALGAGAFAVAGGIFVPMGRRRGWRPGRRTPPTGNGPKT